MESFGTAAAMAASVQVVRTKSSCVSAPLQAGRLHVHLRRLIQQHELVRGLLDELVDGQADADLDLSGEGAARTIPLGQFKDEAADRQAPVSVSVEEEAETYEISPELMYTAEFAVPEPRLVILTEAIEPEERAEPAKDREIKRPRRRRGRGGRGRRPGEGEAGDAGAEE